MQQSRGNTLPEPHAGTGSGAGSVAPPQPPARRSTKPGGAHLTMSAALHPTQYRNQTLQRLYVAQEYQDLGRAPPRHVYVLPVPSKVLELHGVVFVAQGAYGKGIFRFKIVLPDEFPDASKPPRVEFLDQVYHPLVCARPPYRVQLSEKFPRWVRSKQCCLREVVKFVKSLFSMKSFETTAPLNADALYLYRNDRSMFHKRQQACATAAARQQSRRAASGKPDPNFAIPFDQENKSKTLKTRRALRLDGPLPPGTQYLADNASGRLEELVEREPLPKIVRRMASSSHIRGGRGNSTSRHGGNVAAGSGGGASSGSGRARRRSSGQSTPSSPLKPSQGVGSGVQQASDNGGADGAQQQPVNESAGGDGQAVHAGDDGIDDDGGDGDDGQQSSAT